MRHRRRILRDTISEIRKINRVRRNSFAIRKFLPRHKIIIIIIIRTINCAIMLQADRHNAA